MMGATHWVIGGASWLGVLVALSAHGHSFGLLAIAGGFAIASVSALEPDIDSKKSMASRMLGPITGAISWCVRTLFGGHRKITHSLLGWGIVTVIVFSLSYWLHIPYWIPLSIAVGWASHILADMTTRVGCPLFWPGNKHNYGLHLVETGKGLETMFIRPMSVVLCVVFGILLIVGI
jgi:membrane-bound metal-dependent hydrolase YbcI (DUF457 family)